LSSVLISLAALGVSFGQETELPVYEIGDIPAQRIWFSEEGKTLAFKVIAPTLGPDPSVAMSVSSSQEPDGLLAFNEETDTFNYTPALTDADPFTVAFLGVGDGTPIVQEVEIEPFLPLPSETDSFGLEPGAPLPNDEENDKYFTYSETVATEAGFPEGSTPIWFNEVDRPETRAVTIAGRTIILEKDHPNGIFEKIHYDALSSPNQNIERLEIIADRLIFRDSIHLPQTDVTIRALEMVFEDREGTTTTITTTPLVPDGGVRPPPAGESGFLSEAEAGSQGGDLALYVKDLQTPDDSPRFILSGGKGRAASSGKNGTANTSTIAVVSEQGYNNLLGARLLIDHPIADSTQYRPSKARYDETNGWGSKAPATYNGGNATAPGRPGIGGDGGNFSWSFDARNLVSSSAGPAGDKAANATGGLGSKFKRGSTLYNEGWVWRGTQKVNTFGTPTGSPVSNSGYPRKVTTNNGANANAPSASGVGNPGTLSDTPANAPDWLSPEALRYSLVVLRDAYLDGHFDFLEEQVQRYLDAISDAESNSGWEDLNVEDQDAIEEIRDEMLTLQSRLTNNLDFFGNPAGWVPMLSFEVNYAAFEQEIDRALRVMYLNYWLGNIATDINDRVTALKEIREQTLEQIKQDRSDYSNAVDEIPGVRVQAEELQDEIDRVVLKIQAIEKEVLKKAKQVVAAKKVARTLGKIAQMIPVYQPALGTVGGAVAASADIDPNKSWEENAINVGTGGAEGFAAGNALPKANSAKSAMNGINTDDGDLADDPEVRAALKASRGPLLELSKDVGGLLLSNKGLDPEVAAELQRLLAENPAFRSLQKELEKLNATKRDFAAQISDLLQKLTVLPIQVARNLRVISKLNTEISAEADKLDPTTLSFLDDIGARAEERLQKYHYFMSRAYAYRRLESYPGTLNLQDIFDKIVELAGSNGADISVEQFDTLKAVYESQISDVAEAILNEANENPSEQSISVLFELPQSTIDQINAGEVARLNLIDLDLFPESEENLRITGLEVTTMDLLPDSGAPDPNAYSIVFKHSGISHLQKGGHTYQFRHYNERTRSAITWKSVYQFLNNMIVSTEPSAASQSLIGTLVNKSPSDILIFTRPAVDAELLISSEINTPGAKVELRSAQVRVSYDFTAKSEFIKSVKVAAGPNGILPEIKVLEPDISQRTHGRETFERFYDRNTEVTIQAPQVQDGFEFQRWEGSSLSDPTNPEQTLMLSNSYQLTPIYKAIESFQLSVEGGTGSGEYELGEEVTIVADERTGLEFLRWTGDAVERSSSSTTTVPIYGETSVSAVFESNIKAAISIVPTDQSGRVAIKIRSESNVDWTLQSSSTPGDWTTIQNVSLIDGQIETEVDLGTEPAFFQVIPTPGGN